MDAKKILIIDDDTHIQFTLRKRLTSKGFECTTAGSVANGLEKFRKSRPDLVLLDLGFPGPSGTAFLENVKEGLPSEAKIPPILVLSCYNDKEIVELVLNEGAVGFIAKPYDPNVLISTIQSFLNLQ